MKKKLQVLSKEMDSAYHNQMMKGELNSDVVLEALMSVRVLTAFKEELEKSLERLPWKVDGDVLVRALFQVLNEDAQFEIGNFLPLEVPKKAARKKKAA